VDTPLPGKVVGGKRWNEEDEWAGRSGIFRVPLENCEIPPSRYASADIDLRDREALAPFFIVVGHAGYFIEWAIGIAQAIDRNNGIFR
jgi:hypothetical protein